MLPRAYDGLVSVVSASLPISRYTVHFEFYPSPLSLIGLTLNLPWFLETNLVPSEPTQCISDMDFSLAPTPLSDNSPCVSQAPCIPMTLSHCLLRVRKQAPPSNGYQNLTWMASKRSRPPSSGKTEGQKPFRQRPSSKQVLSCGMRQKRGHTNK